MERNEKKSSENDLSELPEINKELYGILAKKVPSHLAKLWLPNTRISNDGTVYIPYIYNSSRVARYFGDSIKEYFKSKGLPVNLNYVVHEGLRSSQINIPLGNFRGDLENWTNESPETSDRYSGNTNNDSNRKYLFNSVVSRTEYPKNEGKLFVHSGIKEAVSGIDLIVDDVLNGDMRAKQYLILGNNSAGKTALSSYAIRKFFAERIPVGYVDVNRLVKWLSNSNGDGKSPNYVRAAYDADVIILDELGKICRADGGILPGTQGRIRNLLDHANNKGSPVIMLYTGDMNNYQKMLRNLQSKKGENWGNDVARDLGSRLEERTSIWIKGLCDSDRSRFIEEYLKQEDVPVNLNSKDAIRGIHDTLSSNAQIRKVIGYTNSVIFKARCNSDRMIEYDEVVKMLESPEQKKMLGKYEGAGDAFKKVADYTGVSKSDMKNRGRPANISNARALTAWVLRNEVGESWVSIAETLGKSYSAMILAVKKIDDVLASEESGLNSRQRKLRMLVEGFKSSQG